ncbi:hypothetical protein E4U42_000778 [Claviceps africana]|uniref:Uncharacterized protein n=1 Tax=Claviceps africana TaxID=83212 RepID=A0A8K0NKE1_9HYPO|nr:hypothetical protein E4U42_000778 [Claviceps africana]
MSRNQNSRHVQAGHDDAAPPPYSETDVYSSSPRTNLSGRPLDDAASQACSSRSSCSSTGGHVIYTPPLTPRTPSSTNTHGHHSPQQQQQQQQQQQPLHTQTSAPLYFASRPPPVAENGSQTDILVYVIKVQGSSAPDDFPYHDHWAARDVTRQDWATFVNFLLANDATEGIDAVTGRESRTGSKSNSRVEGKLDNGREEQPAAAVAVARGTSTRAIEATMEQWNDGFFGPRGMHLVLNKQQTGPGVQQDIDACAAALGGLSVDNSRVGNIPLDDTHPRHDHHDGHYDHGERCWHGPQHGGSHHVAHDEARGRPRQGHPAENHQRTSSASSTSSSAASSGSSSASIGSLPGYDDVNEYQLPLYAGRLQEWASHPDQIRTRHDVEALKAELQAAGSRSVIGSSAGALGAADKRAPRKQIRALQAQWKSIKKAQRQTRRAHKRERRQRRRAEKRERRQQRRAMRRASRELRKARKAGRGGPATATAGPLSGVPVPAVPPVVSATAAPEHMPRSQGHGCGCGDPRTPRSSFFFRPDGPFGRQGLPGAGRGCRGRGHGGERGPGLVDADGAWPEDKHTHTHTTGMAAASVPAPGPVPAAKYQAAEQLDAEMSKMAVRTASLGHGAERMALERATEALARNRDRLRMEADEAYARDVAASGG